jgi:hypothetical protein
MLVYMGHEYGNPRRTRLSADSTRWRQLVITVGKRLKEARKVTPVAAVGALERRPPHALTCVASPQALQVRQIPLRLSGFTSVVAHHRSMVSSHPSIPVERAENATKA